MKELWKRIIEASGAKIYSLIAGMVTLIITARYLGPEGRGTVAAITTWVGLFSTFGYLSLGQVAIYRAAQNQDEEWFPKTFGALVFFTLTLTSLSCLIAYGLYFFNNGKLYGELPSLALLLGFTMLPLMIWEQYSSSLLMAIDHLRVYNKAQIVGRTIGLFAVVLLVGLLGWGIFGAITANILAQSVVALIGIKLLWKRSFNHLVIDYIEIKSMLSGGLKLHLNAIGTFLFSQSNILILNAYASKAEVGWYQFAFQLVGIMLIIPQAASMVFYSRMGPIGPDRFWPEQKKMGLQVLALMVALSIIAYILAPWAIPLVAGDSFKESVGVFRWSLPAILGMSFSTLMANQWIGRGLFIQASILTVISGLVSIILNYILIPIYGMMGSVWVTIIIYLGIIFIVNLIMVILCERNANKKPKS